MHGGLRGERMRKPAGSAPPGSEAGSTMRDVRPESDRAPVGHAHHHPHVGRPAPEQRAVTPHRPAGDGLPADDRYPATPAQPTQPSSAGSPPGPPPAPEPTTLPPVGPPQPGPPPSAGPPPG